MFSNNFFVWPSIILNWNAFICENYCNGVCSLNRGKKGSIYSFFFFSFRRFGRFSRMDISTIKKNPHNWFCCNFVSTIDTFWNITNTWNPKYNAVELKLSRSRKHSRDSLPIDNKKKTSTFWCLPDSKYLPKQSLFMVYDRNCRFWPCHSIFHSLY